MTSPLFTTHIYSFVPGHGFGPAQPRTHRVAPLPCPTYQAPDEDKQRRWNTPTPKLVYLGPKAPDDGWHGDAVAASILVMRSGETREAALHGYAVLDLWPLAGRCPTLTIEGAEHRVDSAPQSPDPSPEVAGILVGRAVAGALALHTRLVVEGPVWALNVLAGVPGVVDYGRNECRAWGRKWQVTGRGWPTAYQVAQRLGGPNPRAFIEGGRAVGSMLMGKHPQRERICAASEGDNRWSIDGGNLGWLSIHVTKGTLYGEPVIRWPSAADPWLCELVGKGEPIEESAA